MPTHNPRINITCEPQVASILTNLAKQEHKSVASLAKELLLEALERREDMFLSALVERREKNSKKRIPHDDAWE